MEAIMKNIPQIAGIKLSSSEMLEYLDETEVYLNAPSHEYYKIDITDKLKVTYAGEELDVSKIVFSIEKSGE